MMYIAKRKKDMLFVMLMFTIMCFSITTLSYTLWPEWLQINRLLGFFIFFEIILITIRTLKKSDVILGIALVILAIWSTVNSEDKSKNLTDLVYYIVTVFLLLKMSDNKVRKRIIVALNYLNRSTRIVILIDFALITISFLFSSSYSSSWGTSSYYRGFTNAAHTLCAGVCLMLALLIYNLQHRPPKLIDYIILAVGLFSILESGARVYLIPAVVIVYFFFAYSVKSRSLKVLVVPIAFVGAIYVFLHSGMIDKLNFVTGNTFISQDASAQFTSGRTEFWVIDLLAFRQLSPLYQLLGKGFDYVYLVNLRQYGLEIWAHNDIIDLLLSAGYVGTIIYIYSFIRLFKEIFRIIERKDKRTMLLIYSVVVMLVNGFFGYQHYLYSFLVLVMVTVNLPKRDVY